MPNAERLSEPANGTQFVGLPPVLQVHDDFSCDAGAVSELALREYALGAPVA